MLYFFIGKTKPHWIVQSFLGLAGFIMSIAWLNIEANEVVSLLEAFGLAFSIDTGKYILYLFILLNNQFYYISNPWAHGTSYW